MDFPCEYHMNYYCFSERRKPAWRRRSMASLPFHCAKGQEWCGVSWKHVKSTELHDFRAARGTPSEYQGNDRPHSLLGSLQFRRNAVFHEISINSIKKWKCQGNCFLHQKVEIHRKSWIFMISRYRAPRNHQYFLRNIDDSEGAAGECALYGKSWKFMKIMDFHVISRKVGKSRKRGISEKS